MIAELKRRWSEPAGHSQLLIVAFPLILSMGSISVLLFVDRMFLSWYSEDAIAAAVPAGMLNFSVLCFFLGVSMYTSTFVAQYTGAKRPERVGPSVWHGIYFALLGGSIIPLAAPFAEQIFAFIGHDPGVQKLEASYFKILNFAAVFFLCNASMSCFYSGRGKSWTIVWVNVSLTLANALLDYALIFGNWGFPRMGIEGAGIATLVSSAMVTITYALLILRPSNNTRYRTRSGWRFDKDLLKRLIRFGTPAGMHFFLDVTGFTIFVMLVGRIGINELTATNIILMVNLLGFLPMVGLGTATSILVGQYQGAGQNKLARRTTWSSLQLSMIYCSIVVLIYISVPEILIQPFIKNPDTLKNQELLELCLLLFKFIAAFTFLDSVAIITGSTLKGAGDTRFVMTTLAITSLFILVIPVYLVVEVMGGTLAIAWAFALLNLLTVSIVFFIRFQSERWENIEVIERQ